MAAVKNPEQFILVAFNANYGLTGGLLFAKDKDDKYYVVSNFQRSEENSRRFPYKATVEDISYLFTSTGVSATGMYTLYCVDGTNSASGSGSGGSSGGEEHKPGSLTYREKTALQALNAMIQLTPNPLAYKKGTVKLLTQKAFEFSDEFIKQAEGIRDETGESGGEGDAFDKEVFEAFMQSFKDAMFVGDIVIGSEGPETVYTSTLQLIKEAINDALFTTVEEEQGGQIVQVKKSIFEVMKDEMVAAVQNALVVPGSGSNPSMSVAEILNAQATVLDTMNDNLGDMKNAQENIADALIGTGSSSDSILDQISAINLGVQNTQAAIGSWSTGSPTILSRLVNIGGNIDYIEDAIGTPQQNEDIFSLIRPLSSSISTMNTNVTNMASDVTTINTTTNTINAKLGAISTRQTVHDSLEFIEDALDSTDSDKFRYAIENGSRGYISIMDDRVRDIWNWVRNQ